MVDIKPLTLARRDQQRRERHRQIETAGVPIFPPEAHLIVQRLIEAGASYRDLMNYVDFPSLNCVRGFCRQHGYRVKTLYWRRVPQEDIERIWRLRREKKSYRQIATIIGCTRNRIVGICYGYQLDKIEQKPDRFVRVL